jgi:hypothetical protein
VGGTVELCSTGQPGAAVPTFFIIKLSLAFQFANESDVFIDIPLIRDTLGRFPPMQSMRGHRCAYFTPNTLAGC